MLFAFYYPYQNPPIIRTVADYGGKKECMEAHIALYVVRFLLSSYFGLLVARAVWYALEGNNDEQAYPPFE